MINSYLYQYFCGLKYIVLNKKDYKIFEIITSLSDKEIRQIRKMLKSPFFTRRADISLLFENLIKYFQKYESFPDTKLLFKKVYPKSTWDYLKLRGTMSDLLELIEECWLINYWRVEKVQSKLIISDLYRRRNLNKCYSSALKKTDQLLENQTKRNAEHYHHLLGFWTQQMKYKSSTSRTDEDLYLQEVSDTNDILYLIQKLQITCAQLSHQLARKRSYDYGLLNDLLQRINQERYLNIPAIAIYYYCFKFLTDSDQLIYFQQFKQLLNKYGHHFSKEELEAPYRLAINFCIPKINEGVSSFIRDSWDLYKEGLAEGILLENNYIPRFTFNNVIAAALRLNELDWIEQFITDSSSQLEDTIREQTISYNLARLEYARENYAKALLHLHSLESKDADVLTNMSFKIYMVKIYLDLNEFDTLNYQLDSFEQFIRRNKVNDYHKTNILNLIRYIRKIVALPIYDKEEKERIRSQIEAESILSERSWLLTKV